MKVNTLSHLRLFATPWTVAYQTPPSMEFSRQECWNGLPFLSPGDLPNPGIEPRSPALQAVTLPSESPGKPIRISSLFWSFLYAFFSFLYFFPTPAASTLWSVFLFYVKFSFFFFFPSLIWQDNGLKF